MTMIVALVQAPKSAVSSYDNSGERSYRLGAYGGSSVATPGGGGAAVPLAEQDAEKRRREVRLGCRSG